LKSDFYEKGQKFFCMATMEEKNRSNEFPARGNDRNVMKRDEIPV